MDKTDETKPKGKAPAKAASGGGGLYFIKLTIDVAFKYIFGDLANLDLLKELIKDITKLPIERLEDLTFLPDELHRDSLTDHKTIVDVRAALTDGEQIEVEMQIKDLHDMGKRSLYTWAKMYSAQLKKSGRYIDLKKCVCINIVNFDYTKSASGYSKKIVADAQTKEAFMDEMEIHFVELTKREKVGDARLRKWMELFSAQTWEDMAEVAKGDEVMRQVYENAQKIAANAAKRLQVERREKFLIDQNTLEWYARTEGIEIGKAEGIPEGEQKRAFAVAQRMLQKNRPIDEISEFTGLSEDEIKGI